MLKLDRTDFSYGETPVLKAVCAEFASGKMTGVIGPNGSGKSTLIKLLSGELQPQGGQVSLAGTPLRAIRLSALAKQVAVVPQQSRLDFEFTVLDVVLMGRAPYIGRFGAESEEDLRIARAAMKAVRIDHLADRPAPLVSGGEWQRVIVARALCQHTPIILLDEPVSSLDIAHQLDVLRLVQNLTATQDKTAVCVLHDLNLAAHYCDELLLLKEGRVYAFGTPAEVLTPQSILDVYGVVADVQLDRFGRPSIVPAYDERGTA